MEKNKEEILTLQYDSLRVYLKESSVFRPNSS